MSLSGILHGADESQQGDEDDLHEVVEVRDVISAVPSAVLEMLILESQRLNMLCLGYSSEPTSLSRETKMIFMES